MSKSIKRVMLSIMVIFALLCFTLGITLSNSVVSSADTIVSDFEMQYGASVRVNTNVNDFTGNGLRFSANISATDYEKALEKEKVSFGMFIMPEEYVDKFGTLSAENVSSTGVYDWCENDGESYFYGGETIKTNAHRIICVSYETLTDVLISGQKIIRGSVVGIKDANLALEYVGRAFVRYQENGEYVYEMADWHENYRGNNVRSIINVAKAAIADVSSNLTTDAKAALQTGYIQNDLAKNEGYTAITTADEFYAMTNGKYYLANDINLSNWLDYSKPSSEFTGVLNGNGKTLTIGWGGFSDTAALFKTFNGTLTDLTVNFYAEGYMYNNAIVAHVMNGGLMENVTVTATFGYKPDGSGATLVHTLNDGVINECTVTVDTVDDNTSTDRIYALVSNVNGGTIKNTVAYVNDTTNVLSVPDESVLVDCQKLLIGETAKQYFDITFASSLGIKTTNTYIKEYEWTASDGSLPEWNKHEAFVSGGGTVVWNKDKASVSENTAYYAMVTGVKDDGKEWTTVMASAFKGGIAYDEIAPASYATVTRTPEEYSTGTNPFATVSLAQYSDLRFAMRSNTNFTFSDETSWAAGASGGYWQYVTLSRNASNLWDVNIVRYSVWGRDASTSFTDLTANTLAELVPYFGYESVLYATEVQGVMLDGVWGDQVADSALLTGVSSSETAPDGYWTITSLEVSGNPLSDMDIRPYNELRFAIKATDNNIAFDTNWVTNCQADNWAYIVLTKNANGSWKLHLTHVRNGEDKVHVMDGLWGNTLKTVLKWQATSATSFLSTEVRGLSDENYVAEYWGEKIVDSVLKGGISTTEENYKDYESISKITTDGNNLFVSEDVSKYTTVKFALKPVGGKIVLDATTNWSCTCVDGYWSEVTLVKQTDGTWTLTLVKGHDGSTGTLSGISASALNSILAANCLSVSATTIYATELRGEKTEEEVVAANSALNGGVATTEESLEGYESISKLTIATSSPYADNPFATLDISGYTQIKFAIKPVGGKIVLDANTNWSCTCVDGYWSEVTLVKQTDGSWTLTLVTGHDGSTGTLNGISASALNVILKANGLYAGNDASEGFTVYATELQGVRPIVQLWGDVILEQGIGETTLSVENAPEGYVKVYSKSGFAKGDFVNFDISQYQEIRFQIKVTPWILFSGWSIYNASKSWLPVTMTKTSDGWVVVVDAKCDGGSEDTYTFTSTSNDLSEVLASWDSDSGETVVYVTEIRGELVDLYDESYEPAPEELLPEIEPETWGDTVANSALNGGVATTEESLEGYESISKLTIATSSPYADNPFATLDISGYTQIKFAIKPVGGDVIFDNAVWSCHCVAGYWSEVTLVKQTDGTWTLTLVKGHDGNTGTLSGIAASALNEILKANGLYAGNDTGTEFTVYATELQGLQELDLTEIDAIVYGTLPTEEGNYGYAEMKYAAEELQYFIKKFTGKEIPIKVVSHAGYLSSSEQYIILGDLAADFGCNYSGLTTDTGYKAVRGKDDIYIYGATKYGTLNGVYGFLNTYTELEFFSDEVYTYNGATEIVVGTLDKTFNPDIDYAWAIDGMLTVGQTAAPEVWVGDNWVEGWPNWAYQRRLGFVNPIVTLGGGNWHNFTSIVSYEEYGTQYADYFTTITNVNEVEEKTLLLAKNDFALAEVVAKEIYELAIGTDASLPGRTIYQFSAPDSNEWPSYTEGDSIYNTYGTHSAEYILFMNKVAQIFDEQYASLVGREITFALLAYNVMMDAPAYNDALKFYSSDNVKVSVMFAPVQMNLYRSIDDDTVTSYQYDKTNKYYADELAQWKALCPDKIYFWNYSTYFDNYFMPLDTVNAMQGTYQYAQSQGVTAIYDQAQIGSSVSTDWTALKIYLKGQLAKDVDVVLWTDESTMKGGIVEKFFKAYYGNAWENMLTLYATERAWLDTLATKSASSGKETLGTGHLFLTETGTIWKTDLFEKKYWDNDGSTLNYDSSMLKTWYGYITSALNTTTDTDVQNRIKVEALTIQYLMVKVYGDTTYGTLAEIATEAKALGVTMFSEGVSVDNIA